MAAMRRGLSRGEAEARDSIVRMSAAVAQSVADALRCFSGHDPELARATIARDAFINEWQRKIEERCFTTIALQQPVASDLRVLVADMQIAIELERIADHAADIAKIVLHMEARPSPVFVEAIEQLGQTCGRMLDQVVSAYRDRDPRAARAVAADDDGVDRCEKRITADLLAHLGRHPEQLGPCTHALWVAHNLERVGDRVTNIAERVVFMVSGQQVDLNR